MLFCDRRLECCIILARSFAGERAITARALHQLDRYAWPENIAELRSVIVRAAQLAGDDPIDTMHLPMHLQCAPEYLLGTASRYRQKGATLKMSNKILTWKV